jgi:dihydroorotate dehydrogenase
MMAFQPGNPKPRFFRLPEDSAVINRYGFNSSGHRQTLHRLQTRLRLYAESHPSEFPGYNPSETLAYRDLVHSLPEGLPKSLRPGRLLAVNLGKNKTSKADDHEDYVKGVKMLGPYADVIVVNVSSPNTPGLRGLQRGESLFDLLSQVVSARDSLPSSRTQDRAKVVVKIAPDLEEEEIEGIARAVRQSGVEGVIVSNTTVKRDGLGLISGESVRT